jgi:hypothetical protein
MGIKLSWDNPDTKTTIRYDFESDWTSDDFFDAIRADDDMIASVEHTVHLMFDMRRSEHVPFVPVSKLRELAGGISQRTGLIVLVGADMWMNVLANVFQKVYAPRVQHFAGLRLARTPEHAREIIVEYEKEHAG